MSETTRITTVKITAIVNVDDESEIETREEIKEEFGKVLRDRIDADNVVVTDVQDFVMEDTSCNGGKE